ncbi:PucR family transcriptional regulator [Variovorax sp. E3]|uniref:PucR family transcriptional regulator n=1 Tax=Variovorax sp. E3 TaxID=1914993 RepID=UPI0018DE7C7E|nr:PucR family transcriptional regulator [Variovorax sp. E3]
MNLREALATSPLDAGVIVAGGAHLDREISWVQVVDHPDIEAWVERGQLLLSTGYSWPKTGKAARVIVEKLAAKGACGVVLAVPHFMQHFPAQSIEAAERVGLPLIELAWEIPFSEITRVVHRELMDQQGRALAKSEQIHRELTQAAVSGDGLFDVVRVLGTVLERAVAITALDGSVLATHPAAWLSAEVFRQHQGEGALSRIDAEVGPVRLQAATQAAVVGHAVRIRAERAGYVWVDDSGMPMSELDLRAVEHAGTVAALQIAHQRELSAQEARLGDALVASLVEGRFDEKPQTLERARLLGWRGDTAYRLCAVLLDEPNPLSREGFQRREEVGLRMGHALERLRQAPLISLSANQVHALVPEGVDIAKLWAALQLPRMAMGVSQPHSGVEGMHRAGKEIADLVEHLKPGRLHFFEEMLFPRVLAGDAAAQKIFVSRLFGPLEDGKRGQHLLDTALALADEGFHLQRTADRLGVHISTLRYRHGRLAELSGLDLESVEGRFRLQVAARLYLMQQP